MDSGGPRQPPGIPQGQEQRPSIDDRSMESAVITIGRPIDPLWAHGADLEAGDLGARVEPVEGEDIGGSLDEVEGDEDDPPWRAPGNHRAQEDRPAP